MPNVYIETYGCSANQSDSEIMAGLLSRSGFIIVASPEPSDAIIVNTCAVKGTTERKVLYRISELAKLRKPLVIAGCIPEAELLKLREVTDANVIGPRRIKQIVSVVAKTLEGKRVEELGFSDDEKVGLPKIRKNPVVDIVEISEGCMSACSFCITRLARGSLRSYRPGSIVREIDEAHKSGVKEFWLTSQDTGCYGFDTSSDSGTILPELINRITDEVKGQYFLRIGMMNPQHAKRILPELIECYKNKNVFKFAHIPVQSGSNSVLREMKRGHSAQDYKDIVAKLKQAVPEITIWTDIIAGFPGETEEDFEATKSLLKETRPDFVNISAFASRPGTEAAKMKQLSTEIKKQRTRELTELVDSLSLERNKRWLGWAGTALVDEYNVAKGTWVARNASYKPIVFASKEKLLGKFVDVKITDVEKNHLKGVIA